MRLRVRVTRSRRGPETITIFGSAEVQPRRRCLPLLGSLAAHMVFFLALSMLGEYASWLESEREDLSAYRVEYIRLRVPDPLYYRVSAAKPRPPAAKRRAETAQQASSSPAGGMRGPQQARRFQLPPVLELPGTPELSKADAVILQPDIRIHPPAAPGPVPSLAFWARQVTAPPKPLKRLRLPGRTEQAAPRANLSAPPVLAVSNREAAIADINIGAAASRPSAALPVPPSATVPIRMRDHVSEARTGPVDPIEGDATNVIALSAEAMPANRVVAVQQGVVVRAAGGSGGAGGFAPGGDRTANDPGTSPDGRAEKQQAQAAANNANGGNRQGNGSPVRPSGSDSARNVPDSRPENGRPPSSGPVAAQSGRPPVAVVVAPESAPGSVHPPDAVPVTRIKHPPSGIFDVVIMQSSAGDEVPEAEGVLTGSPVYTVYLVVGGDKEWRMQFCLSGRAPVKTGTYQVNAEETGALTPPYPVSTVVPNSVLTLERPRYSILHGLLTAAGKLRNMVLVESHNAAIAQVIPLLDQWQFRPAMRDGQPVEVEVLLAIPPRT